MIRKIKGCCLLVEEKYPTRIQFVSAEFAKFIEKIHHTSSDRSMDIKIPFKDGTNLVLKHLTK